jgi:hypothetical protein
MAHDDGGDGWGLTFDPHDSAVIVSLTTADGEAFGVTLNREFFDALV